MHFWFLRFPTLLVLGILLSEGVGHAEYMNWSYHWSISPAPVLASGTGSVAQALGWGGMGSTHILGAAVTTSSSATARDPDHFAKSFNLTLHLTDGSTHQSGSLTFHGLISGTLSSTTAHLTETFTTPLESLRLGSHVYWVRLPSRLNLLPPGAPVVPYYDATVRVTNFVPPPPIRMMTASPLAAVASIASIASVSTLSTPEPSTLVLVVLGTVLLAGAGMGRSRRLFRAAI